MGKLNMETTKSTLSPRQKTASTFPSTLSPKQKTTSTFRSFAELSTMPTSPGIASKLSLKTRTSGTETALSSTCKTASGRPGLVNRVTPYHAGLENSHGGQYEN